MIKLQDAGDYISCDFPRCPNKAINSFPITDDDGEDQGQESLCREHAPVWAH